MSAINPYPWTRYRAFTDRRLLGTAFQRAGLVLTILATVLCPPTVIPRFLATHRFHTLNDHWAPRGAITAGAGAALTLLLFRPEQWWLSLTDLLTYLGPHPRSTSHPLVAFTVYTLIAAGPALIAQGLAAIGSSFAYEYQAARYLTDRELTRAQTRRINRARRTLTDAAYPNDGYLRIGVIVDDPIPWRQTRRGAIVERPLTGIGVTLVIGAAGSGKSIALISMAEQTLRIGGAVTFIDFKGSAKTARRLEAIADELGVPFYSFTILDDVPGGDTRFDFFSWNKTPAQSRAILMEALEFTTEGDASYYRDIAENWLHLQFTALQHVGLRRGEGVFDFLADTDTNNGLSKRLQPLRSGTPEERVIANRITDDAQTISDKDLQSLRNNIERIQSSAGNRLTPPTKPGDAPMVDHRSLEAEGALLYVGLPATGGTAGMRSLGALFLADLTSFVEDRLTNEHRPDRRPFLGIVDEASQLGERAVVLNPVITQNREADTGIALGAQSLTRYPDSTRDEILQNITTAMLMRMPDGADAQLLTERFGKMPGQSVLAASSVKQHFLRQPTIGPANEQRQEIELIPRLQPSDLGRLEQGQAYVAFSGSQSSATRPQRDQSVVERVRARLARRYGRVTRDVTPHDLPIVTIVPHRSVLDPIGHAPSFESYTRAFRVPAPDKRRDDDTRPDVPAPAAVASTMQLAGLKEQLMMTPTTDVDARPHARPDGRSEEGAAAEPPLDFSSWNLTTPDTSWEPTVQHHDEHREHDEDDGYEYDERYERDARDEGYDDDDRAHRADDYADYEDDTLTDDDPPRAPQPPTPQPPPGGRRNPPPRTTRPHDLDLGDSPFGPFGPRTAPPNPPPRRDDDPWRDERPT